MCKTKSPPKRQADCFNPVACLLFKDLSIDYNKGKHQIYKKETATPKKGVGRRHKMLFIIFMWMIINVLNFAMKKDQPDEDWYFYYSMVVGTLFTVILMFLI